MNGVAISLTVADAAPACKLDQRVTTALDQGMQGAWSCAKCRAEFAIGLRLRTRTPCSGRRVRPFECRLRGKYRTVNFVCRLAGSDPEGASGPHVSMSAIATKGTVGADVRRFPALKQRSFEPTRWMARFLSGRRRRRRFFGWPCCYQKHRSAARLVRQWSCVDSRWRTAQSREK